MCQENQPAVGIQVCMCMLAPCKIHVTWKLDRSDEERLLFLIMTIRANTELVKERLGICRVASEMNLQ